MAKPKLAYPSPGSPEAIALGCRCPVIDNGHGRGAYIDEDGEPMFWQNAECPLHGIHAHDDSYLKNGNME